MNYEARKYVLKYDEKKTKQNPMPYAILSLRGADATSAPFATC